MCHWKTEISGEKKVVRQNSHKLAQKDTKLVTHVSSKTDQSFERNTKIQLRSSNMVKYCQSWYACYSFIKGAGRGLLQEARASFPRLDWGVRRGNVRCCLLKITCSAFFLVFLNTNPVIFPFEIADWRTKF